VNKLSKETKYDKVLQELKSEFNVLMNSYLQKLHTAFHEDNGLSLSHDDFVDKVRQDCMSIFSNGRITFDERSEEEVIKEILEYNFDVTDIEYMKGVEGINLFSHLHSLNEGCLKRTDPEWFQFGADESPENGQIGSKRTQFCKYCGEQIHISYGSAQ
jgi:hypothetical protein